MNLPIELGLINGILLGLKVELQTTIYIKTYIYV